ncbi:hypothetical protein R3W88_024536 [Solanum pinnatisectum]|uniref:Reverse transcriptase domain-containing protein n=1 Tax=Solanum pinnatisectum TaxID=50273 RepID=A0AAV9M1D4_9SOLN|nr:hypothetical protein R3W88_024536 [Solanum pinnatisectum]
MDELARSIQEEVPWCMLFADDMVVIDETQNKVNARLKIHEANVEVRLDTRTIPKRVSFKYIGSISQGSGDIDDDVTHHIGEACMKWRFASRVLCDKKGTT